MAGNTQELKDQYKEVTVGFECNSITSEYSDCGSHLLLSSAKMTRQEAYVLYRSLEGLLELGQ